MIDKKRRMLAGCGVVVDFKTRTEKEQEQNKALGEDGFAQSGTDSVLTPDTIRMRRITQ